MSHQATHSVVTILSRGIAWLVLIAGLGVASCLLQPFTRTSGATETGNLDWSKAETITMRMEEFRFVPDHLRLHKGTPYRLHLVNAGEEMHEFTAPDFFRSVLLRDRTVLGPYGNQVVLQPHDEANVFFVAQQSGIFAPTCADHDWAGMKATIIVDWKQVPITVRQRRPEGCVFGTNAVPAGGRHFIFLGRKPRKPSRSRLNMQA